MRGAKKLLNEMENPQIRIAKKRRRGGRGWLKTQKLRNQNQRFEVEGQKVKTKAQA